MSTDTGMTSGGARETYQLELGTPHQTWVEWERQQPQGDVRSTQYSDTWPLPPLEAHQSMLVTRRWEDSERIDQIPT